MAKDWVQKVKSISTFPPDKTFTKSAKEVAKVMADPSVSPKGLGSAIKMIQYFINRGGKALSKERKDELKEAENILRKKHRTKKKK